ncbi:hypothetical protein CFC21_103644 [Triticum aestivum]|uniref:NAC domain-containing protein n=2 Tax=Triticum aestivum TaxID=4565 RepID=A0A3B6SFI4_WHEAT|nr:uncharacterized protein LOC123159752 [Triticum aestivum]KAF7102527.1 hypothetical protein CFC21_103644 [Triticum aestivum]
MPADVAIIKHAPTRSSCRARTQVVVPRQLLLDFHPTTTHCTHAVVAMEKMQKAVAVVNHLWWNRHGFPQGYHFVPSDLELIRLLEDIIAGRPLPHPLPTIFRNVRIRDYHPAELYERYKAHKEAGSIYFFSEREFPGGARVRPRRFTKDGWWKASGGGESLRRRGLTVGSKLTLVFYDKKPGQKVGVKTDWAIKEYTKIVDKKKAEEMALYRLYKMNKPANAKHPTQEDENTPNSTWANEEAPPPSPPHPTFSQAQAGQTHDYHNHYYFGVEPGPSTSRSVTPDAGHMGLTGSSPAAPTYLPQHNGVRYTDGLRFWDALPAMAPSLVSSGPAAVAHGLPTSAAHFSYQETAVDAEHFGYQETTTEPMKTQLLPASAEHFVYQETTDPLKTQLLPASAEHFVYQETTDPPKTQLPPPAAQGDYLADEFDVWCEMQQGSQQVAVSPSSPMPDNIDLQQVAASSSSPTPDDIDSQRVAVSPSSPMPDNIDSQQVAASSSSPTPDDIDSQQAAASPFPKLEDIDFPMLEDVDFAMLEDIDFAGLLEDIPTLPTDENGERFSCTLQELLYPKIEDDAPPPLADVDGQGSGPE